MSLNLDRQNSAKKLIQGKGRSVDDQRTDRRQRLIAKFKSLRIQAIDSFRKLEENELTYEVLFKLKKEILSTLDEKELLEVEQLSEFLTDLEDVLEIVKQEEHEYYEKLYNEEIEAIADNLMNKCDICDDLIIQKGICEGCTQKHITSNF